VRKRTKQSSAASNSVADATESGVMMPRPARIFLAAAGALWLAAIVYGYVTGGDRLGPITLGWWGGIGEATGFVVLLAAALGAAALAATFLVGRASLDAPDPSDGVASAPSFAPSLAPLLAAAGLASVTVGLALGWPLVALGLLAIAGSASRWSEPARSDLGVATPRSIEEAPADRGPVPARTAAVGLERLLSWAAGVTLAFALLAFIGGLVSDHESSFGIVVGLGAACAAFALAASRAARGTV
jgi:hypothetical protein